MVIEDVFILLVFFLVVLGVALVGEAVVVLLDSTFGKEREDK